MPSEKKHILVTGSNRSGTTWVGKMLCASNELNYIYEPFSDDYNTLKVDTPVKHHFHYVTNNESQYFKRYIDCCLSPMNISLIKYKSILMMKHCFDKRDNSKWNIFWDQKEN